MATRSSHSAKKSQDNEDGQAASADLENQLLETLERYELIFKATNDVLYELDLPKGTVVWNDALYTQYGYDRREPAGTLEWWTAHIHPDDALRLEHELSKWFEGNQDTWQGEYRFRGADGGYINVRDRGVLQRAADGTPLRIIGSFLDITKQKQLDHAKDEFISLVSHQLRTPLTVIRLSGEMLTDGLLGQLSSEQETYIRHITDASIRLIKLVGDILDVSRFELGRMIAEPMATNVNELLETCVAAVRPLAAQKGAIVKFNPDRSIGKLALDQTIFEQIVHNLLTNAIRYSNPKHGVIKVVFRRNADGYLLHIRDNGIGIPKAAQPHVFNRFYRADNAVNIEEHGTGLGLYLVKIMTDAFGGRVWFDSTQDKGTTFYVQLPVHGMRVT